jgi:hypothetical protein
LPQPVNIAVMPIVDRNISSFEGIPNSCLFGDSTI